MQLIQTESLLAYFERDGMFQSYGAFENLRKHNVVLHESVTLYSGIQLAAWSNKRDVITQYCDHHILSLYIVDSHESYHKTAGGWKNGGGPDRFCLIPKESGSSWDIHDDLSLVHLYCTDVHLREMGEKVWDKNPYSLMLDERTFGSDPGIAAAYCRFLLGNDRQQLVNYLALCVAPSLLLTHLAQYYSNVQWRPPIVTGGLAPATLHNVLAYIEAHLVYPITLSDPAGEAALSEFYFARMFCQSMNVAPHQYVMQCRMALAQQLVYCLSRSLSDIAMACGFSSASHFSNRFKQMMGKTPTQLRAVK